MKGKSALETAKWTSLLLLLLFPGCCRVNVTPFQKFASQMVPGNLKWSYPILHFGKQISTPALEEVCNMRFDCTQTSVLADGRMNAWLNWCHGSAEAVSAHWWDNSIFKALKLVFELWFLDREKWSGRSEVSSKVIRSFSGSYLTSPQGWSQAIIRSLFILIAFAGHCSLSLDFWHL